MGDPQGRNFGEWIEDLFRNPTAGGAKGCFFYIVALPLMVICGIMGLHIFPEGTYPRIVLIAPGIVLGGIAIFIYGYIVYKLPSFFAIVLSLVISLFAYQLAYRFAMIIVNMLTNAI